MLVININKINGDIAVYEGSIDELYDVISTELGAKTDEFITSVVNARGGVRRNNVAGVYFNI